MKTKLILILFVIISSKVFTQTEFSQESAEKILKVLATEIGPRTMGSPAEQKALNFAKEKFQSFGCDKSYVKYFYYIGNTNTSSGYAVGIKYGKTKQVIVIGGHIDSAGPEILGANDNASGSAVVLELARILSKRNNQSTLIFVLFGGEEAGLAGSQNFLNNFEIDNWLSIDSVMLMLNIDMANGLGDIEIDPHGSKFNAPKWLVKAAVEEYYKLGYKNLIYPIHAQAINNSLRKSASSDHEPFIDKGIPAIDFTTDINTPIHTPQDIIENFDPRGLKRSGEIVLKLIERFDSGIPSRSVEKYWFYLLGKYPIFLPIWSLKVFIVLVFVLAVITVLLKRKKRLIVYNTQIVDNNDYLSTKAPAKFNGVKIFVISIIPPLLGMFSFYLISWIKKVNHPWYADPLLYYLNALIFFLLGVWLTLHLSKRLSLSRCPYPFFFDSVLVLTIFLIGLALVDTRLAIYPAISLLLILLAILARIQIIKILFLFLAPLPILRLIFNEWFYFILRMYIINSIEFPGRHLPFIVNGFFVVFFAIVFFPFFLAFSSGYRESILIQNFFKWFKSKKILTALTTLIVVLNFYLYMQPSYNNLWQRTVLVNQKFDLTNDKFSITLRSPEYLTGIKLKMQGKDTVIDLLEKQLELIKLDSFSIKNYKIVTEKYLSSQSEGKDIKELSLTKISTNILMLEKPYKIDIKFKGNKNIIDGTNIYKAEPELYLQSDRKMINDTIMIMTIKLYSFPDVPLKIVGECIKSPTDTISQEVKVTYNYPLFPIKLQAEHTNFIFRTELIKEEKF